MRTLFVIISILSTITLAVPALATEDPACRYGNRAAWEEVAPLFVGLWQIAHHAGFYMAGPMTMPFPASADAETMELVLSDFGHLFGTHPEAPAPIPFIWADEPAWTFADQAEDDGIPGPILSSEDVESLVGCDLDQLARLIGQTQVTIDGVLMGMTLRLMVVGPEMMYGIFNTFSIVDGMPVKSWRSVTMTR